LMRGVLAFILLANINFVTTYRTVFQSGILHAGLAPINSAIANGGLNLGATAEFWWSFPSLMTDQAAVTTVPPLTCSTSDDSCVSYFLPGTVTQIVYDPSLPPILKQNFTDAGALLVNDAPGYQIDYSSIASDELAVQVGDCQIYGMPWAALLICIRSIGNSLIGGTSQLRKPN
jgi:hypothetical protein